MSRFNPGRKTPGRLGPERMRPWERSRQTGNEEKKKAKAQTSKGGSNDEETLRAALDTLIQFLPPVYRDEPGKLERALLTHYGMQRPGFMSDLEASYFSLCEEHMLSPQATGEYVRGEIQKALQIVADLWKH